MSPITKNQKHLAIETSDLGKCFMKLEDVLEVYPEFNPKRVYDKVDEKGRLTNEQYVKCKHVKNLVSDQIWKEIKSEVVYDWFKLGRDSDVRLILCPKGICAKKQNETTAIAITNKSNSFVAVSSNDGSSAKAEVTLEDGKKVTAEINPVKGLKKEG